MDIPKLTHNMGGQIIGEIEFSVPFRFTFVYPDNRRNVFDNIMRFAAMRTGCYTLFNDKGVCFVVSPLYEYVIEEPMPNAIVEHQCDSDVGSGASTDSELLLDWAETLLCNSQPMSHCSQEEWEATIKKWSGDKRSVKKLKK